MKNIFHGWSVINHLTLEKVVDLVLTNGTPDSIESDNWILDIIKRNVTNNSKILDFGVGVGRNIFKFSLKAPDLSFIGYDNINMLEFTSKYCNHVFGKSPIDFKNIKLEHDWSILKNEKFGCVYATIVFQHIYEEDLKIYIEDIKKMTNLLIVAGRGFNDDNKKITWKILERCGLYPINASEVNYSSDDPNEHITCVYNLTDV